jgi:hypothetical protein
MRFFHDSILLRKDRPKTFRTAASWLRKISSPGDNRQEAIANRKMTLKSTGLPAGYCQLPIFLKNFSLPCTPFETPS